MARRAGRTGPGSGGGRMRAPAPTLLGAGPGRAGPGPGFAGSGLGWVGLGFAGAGQGSGHREEREARRVGCFSRSCHCGEPITSRAVPRPPPRSPSLDRSDLASGD